MVCRGWRYRARGLGGGGIVMRVHGAAYVDRRHHQFIGAQQGNRFIPQIGREEAVVEFDVVKACSMRHAEHFRQHITQRFFLAIGVLLEDVRLLQTCANCWNGRSKQGL